MFETESRANIQPQSDPEAQSQRPFYLPAHNQEVVRVLLLGDYGGVTSTIHQFAAHGLAEVKHWSPLVPTGRPGEYLSIHTRRNVVEA